MNKREAMSFSPAQNKAFVVYCFGPCPDGKFYVGQTGSVQKRWSQHKKANGSSPAFHAAINLFGFENIPFAIIAETDVAEEADRLECLYIVKQNSLFPHGYNLTLGGKERRFEAGQKVYGFTEDPVPTEDVIELAKHIAFEIETDSYKDTKHLAYACPCCAGQNDGKFILCQCGVHRDFSKHYLRGIAEGKLFDEIHPPLDPKTLKSWRKSVDAEFFVYISKRRSKAAKLADVLPAAAHRYSINFWPYLLTCLRNRVLRQKKKPVYTIGRFIPFKGSKEEEIAEVETEFFLRSRRKQLGSFEENVWVFADYFQRFRTTEGLRWDATLKTIRSFGGSEDEIREALDRNRVNEVLDAINDHLDLKSFYISVIKTNSLAVMFGGEIYDVQFKSKEQLVQLVEEIKKCAETDRKELVERFLRNPEAGQVVSLRVRPAAVGADQRCKEEARTEAVVGVIQGDGVVPAFELFRGDDRRA